MVTFTQREGVNPLLAIIVKYPGLRVPLNKLGQGIIGDGPWFSSPYPVFLRIMVSGLAKSHFLMLRKVLSLGHLLTIK
jgi:hypothetical protein